MLIGLNGRKQAGKDTVYERTARLMDGVLEVERVSFADLLYESAAAALGVTVEWLRLEKAHPTTSRIVVESLTSGEYERASELSVREYLQRYGTEAHRDVFGADFWTEQARPALELHEGRIVMVTDVRFQNEAELVRACGGDVVEVIGPEGRATADAHPSEAPLPEELIDVTIWNDVRDDGFRTLDRRLDTVLRLLLRAG